VPRRLFSAAAIGLALALWSLWGVCAARVRTQISPWSVIGATSAGGWSSLRRWTDVAQALFVGIRDSPVEFTRRQRAERAAASLCAAALPGAGDLREQVFAGAARAVRGKGVVIPG
jgi:hypothetical protein